MTRLILLAPLALLGACNVTKHDNGAATVSLDENRIERTTDVVANQAAEAGDQAAAALRNAGPEIEQGARDIKERAGRVADRVENVDVDVDLNTADNKPAAN